MGLFIEDLLNFGNLIDAELEIDIKPELLETVYSGLNFIPEAGILRISGRKKALLFNRSYEVKIAEESYRVKKDRESGKQWVFFRVLSKGGLDELLKKDGFLKEEEYLGMDVMPALVLTDLYKKVPNQFKDKLVINRYKLNKEGLKAFFKFEK
jgi:hypothetical protein